MRKTFFKLLGSTMTVAMLAGTLGQFPAHAAVENGWEEVDGKRYWYENGVKQGTEGRGKEIYDPGSDAWYWLDAVDGGKMAVSKDVYQESLADDAGNIGKWVRYDGDGHMIKGWDKTGAGTYYFDLIYGTMAKGSREIDGVPYFFNEETGIMEDGSGTQDGWVTIDGRDYWYEGGVRQGYNPNDPAYRGKEIYDPSSDAWYWLDNVQQGAKAVSKDVYQESQADDAGNIGKWVRYDGEGHMVKGWDINESGKYYFDPVYGTMAKGIITIDNITYRFNESSGCCEGEEQTVEKPGEGGADKPVNEYNEDGRLIKEYDADGRLVRSCEYAEDGKRVKCIRYNEDGTVNYEEQYDGNGERVIKCIYYSEDGTVNYEEQYDGNEKRVKRIDYKYDKTGKMTQRYEYYYDGNGKAVKRIRYNEDGKATNEYQYDENGKTVKTIRWEGYAGNEFAARKYETEYDGDGREIKETCYDKTGEMEHWDEYQYDGDGRRIKVTTYDKAGRMSVCHEIQYDGNGEVARSIYYSYSYSYEGGELDCWEEQHYDGNGKLVKDVLWHPDGTSKYYLEHEYDENGKRIKTLSYDRFGKKMESWSEYQYEEGNEQPIRETYYSASGELMGWDEYQYDENGERVKKIRYNPDGSVAAEWN